MNGLWLPVLRCGDDAVRAGELGYADEFCWKPASYGGMSGRLISWWIKLGSDEYYEVSKFASSEGCRDDEGNQQEDPRGAIK